MKRRRLVNSLLFSIVVMVFATGFSTGDNTSSDGFQTAACRSIGAT